ncbi:NADH-quinone oxidoreductase subunit NuoK [Ornithinimicrobium sp. F0845]|uniref:NADH-quinone oxidoreductase subunit NuoK n=1 Tax=Ornithinimicrobium sp. F0845 TaxID=2926412 RepID=UPI001FF69AE4|nr:NADH-quinone oxidoreductase subunit NuoK [Ornithinimicrobium sp. F0845]
MSPALPLLLAAILAGVGTYGVLARRHAVLMLIGVELMLGAAGLILVTVGQFDIGQVGGDPLASGAVLTLFVITIAAAEIVVALAVVMAMFRTRGDVDLTGEAQTVEAEVPDETSPKMGEVLG